MVDLNLVGPFIQASGYRKGRKAAKVAYLALHTAEGATTAQGLGEFFRTHDSGSSNAGVGQDGDYVQYVNYQDTPWTNPPLNEEADTLEMCGFAAWPREEWLKHKAMLTTVAKWIAWRSAVRNIPIRRVTGKQIRMGLPGIVGHKDVNDVYHSSTHWDPGPGFPWDVVLAQAIAIRYPKQSTPLPVAEGQYKVVAGDTWWGIAARSYPKVSPAVTWPRLAAANKNAPLTPGVYIKIPPVQAVNPPKPPVIKKPAVVAPRFPLLRGEYFGPKSGPDKSVSGFYSNRADLEKFQARLKALGYSIVVDGLYGGNTAAAVRRFQRDRNLKVTGLIDAATWRAAWEV